ncbi:hypothetical protein NLI96_g11328 [Meripilus lineatus]|uniref:Mid2 domain-containing protein n=1 Tax=Meripilus lineatus TaxID=2056292 RepID=A0AAD5URZ4_9APHY|nr:hypothetical protein NLI96_g11328 [Physisporinus lineatus]
MRFSLQLMVLPWVLALSISLASAEVQTFDDRDPHVVYKGKWVARGSQTEYLGTTSESRTPGDTAVFTFIGTQIAVYGTIAAGNYTTQSTYTIDQGSPGLFTDPNEIAQLQRHVRFYMSEELPNANHSLTIVNQGDSFYLDFIEVTVPDQVSSTGGSTQPGTSHLSNPLSTDPAGGSDSASSSGGRTKLSNGAIAGIAVTSILVLLVCLLLLYFCAKRRSTDIPSTTPFPHTHRQDLSPRPKGSNTSFQAGRSLGESGRPLDSAAVDPIGPMGHRYSSPSPSDNFSIVPQAQSDRGPRPEKSPVSGARGRPVVAETRRVGAITTESRNELDANSIHTNSNPPVYSRY